MLKELLVNIDDYIEQINIDKILTEAKIKIDPMNETLKNEMISNKAKLETAERIRTQVEIQELFRDDMEI